MFIPTIRVLQRKSNIYLQSYGQPDQTRRLEPTFALLVVLYARWLLPDQLDWVDDKNWPVPVPVDFEESLRKWLVAEIAAGAAGMPVVDNSARSIDIAAVDMPFMWLWREKKQRNYFFSA